MDLRTSSGWYFAITGILLIGVGVFEPGARAPLTDTNVNLYTGIIMVLFGGAMLALARRAAKAENREK